MWKGCSIGESKSKERNKDNNRKDKDSCLGPLRIGDRVLVRNCTGKLRSYWGNEIYMIVDCKREHSLVYEMQQEKIHDRKKRRVRQRNILLTCEAILEEPEGFHQKKEKHNEKPK